MKLKAFSILAAAAIVFTGAATAAPSKTYQVSGPVLEINESIIAVQKGKERWEIARDATTKANAAVKAGDRVTITYTMTATQIEVKGDKGAGTSPSPTSSPAKK